MGEFVGKRVVPDHVGVWDQKKTYEPLMIVLDGETGDSYISRKAVPVGISLADESYWSLCAHYSAQMRKLEQDVDVDVQQMHSDVTAVKNAMSQEFKETHTAISKELDDTHKAISQELSETEQRVNENLEQTSSELTGKVEQAKSDLNTGRQELKDAKDTLNKRMDSIAGGKTSDAEILDARVDSYGHTHNTLGNAIRALRAGEMREAVHEQLAEKYVQELLETEVKKIHGGELYYPYDSSTFSGWVSSYLIDESILVTGIEFIVKARSERISQIRVAIAFDDASEEKISFNKYLNVTIEPNDEKRVHCDVNGLFFEQGRKVFILLQADVICTNVFGSQEATSGSLYTTNGQFAKMEDCSTGGRYNLAVWLTGYNPNKAKWREVEKNIKESLAKLKNSFQDSWAVSDEQNLVPVSYAVLSYTTSTFTGWAAPIGKAKHFNTLVFTIENRKENNAYIEKIRCVVSVNNHKGAILADETREGFHIKSGERRKIEFRFSTPIENENSVELYAGFTCDQHISVMFGNTGKNLNPPDYGAVCYICQAGDGPFRVDKELKDWFPIHDTELINQDRPDMFVEYLESIYQLRKHQLDQVIEVVENLLDKAQLSNPQSENVQQRIGAAIKQLAIDETISSVKQGFDEKIEKLNIETPPRVVLPDKIYGVVDDTLQLFYRGIVEHPNPYNFNLECICDIGKNTNRYFEVTPKADQEGEHKLTLNVRDCSDRIIASATTTLAIRKAGQSPIEKKNILCIGDSLTTGGEWCVELARRVLETGGSPSGLGRNNIEFIGTKKRGQIGYEGYGGWTWASYLAKPSNTSLGMWVYSTHDKDNTDQHSLWRDENGNVWQMETIEKKRIKFTRFQNHTGKMPVGGGNLTHLSNETHPEAIAFTSTGYAEGNPFWDAVQDKISFKSYCERNGFAGIDYVYTLLSWNALGGYCSTPDAYTVKIHVENAKEFIRKLHDEFPEAKVKVMGIQMPSFNGGTGANYGANSAYSNPYALSRSVMGMNLAYQSLANDEEFKNYVEFLNVATQFDSEYNMPATSKQVNTRNKITEAVGTNGVHPAIEGYMQIADVAFRNMAICVLPQN